MPRPATAPLGFFAHSMIFSSCETGQLPAETVLQWLNEATDVRFFTAPALWGSPQLVRKIARPMSPQLRERLVAEAIVSVHAGVLSVAEPLYALMCYESRVINAQALIAWGINADRAFRDALLGHLFLVDNPPLVTRLLSEVPAEQRARFLLCFVEANPSVLARLTLTPDEVAECVRAMRMPSYRLLLGDAAFWAAHGGAVLARKPDNSTLAAAVLENALSVVRTLLAQPQSPVALRNALEAAARFDRPSALAEMLTHAPARAAADGWLLTFAASIGRPHIVQLLLAHGITEPGALEAAVAYRQHDLVRMLLADTRFRAQTELDAPMRRAVELDDTQMVRLLLDAGASALPHVPPMPEFLANDIVPDAESMLDLLRAGAVLELRDMPSFDDAETRWCDDVLARAWD